MKSEFILQIFTFQVFLIIALIIVLYNLFKVRKSLKLERRISKYTVNAKTSYNISLGDEIIIFFAKLVNVMANILSKSSYFKNRAKSYEKYVHNLKNENDSPFKILAIKFIASTCTGITYIISSLIDFKFDFMFLLLLLIVGYFLYDIYLEHREKRRRILIENDLLKAIIIMNNAFKSGYNITQAINMVIKDLKGPICEEFSSIGEDLTYGLEIKDVFDRFYDRVKLDDAKYITSSLSLLSVTGGNLTGIFSSIEISFTNKKRLRDELNAMTSSSNLVYKVLLAMPFILIGIVLMLDPTYFNSLFTSIIGFIICALAIVLFIIYVVLIKKILKVNV